MLLIAPLLGHAGGWDEVLLFAGPVAAVLLWVRWAERRARARREHQDDGAAIPGGETGEPSA